MHVSTVALTRTLVRAHARLLTRAPDASATYVRMQACTHSQPAATRLHPRTPVRKRAAALAPFAPPHCTCAGDCESCTSWGRDPIAPA
eukprot:4270058-Pleurochrysis_carterae.AAC.1